MWISKHITSKNTLTIRMFMPYAIIFKSTSSLTSHDKMEMVVKSYFWKARKIYQKKLWLIWKNPYKTKRDFWPNDWWQNYSTRRIKQNDLWWNGWQWNYLPPKLSRLLCSPFLRQGMIKKDGAEYKRIKNRKIQNKYCNEKETKVTPIKPQHLQKKICS